ncbi:5HT3A protein, partial [Amia calva]|nr:5HT3A protein [Amia calva]
MIIDILSFYLPPHSVDRASFKMTLILGYTVFLLIMNDLLPSTANGTPLIGIYFSVCLALMVISLLETVVITNVLHHSAMRYRNVPRWVRVLVLKHIARLICYHHPDMVPPTAHPDPEDNQVMQPSAPTPIPTSRTSQACTHSHVAVLSDFGEGQRAEGYLPEVPALPMLPELQMISQDLHTMRCHLTSLQKENALLEQWGHVGYILDFLLFRIYLLLISLYALVIICMWCVWFNL